MSYKIRLEGLEKITPDTFRLRFNKPPQYEFRPGQATDVALDQDGWRDEKRPFTFTSLPDELELEFTIKSYPDHDGVTKRIPHLKPGDGILIEDPWGAIEDKGPGVFIAGGAGVTPFIPILKHRADQGSLNECTLVLAAETWDDLILRDMWDGLDGLDVVYVLSDENRDGARKGHVTEDILRDVGVTAGRWVYLCGPPPMEDAVSKVLERLDLPEDRIVRES